MTRRRITLCALLALLALLAGAPAAVAQEPASWGEEPVFHTFSIVAVDPATGEVGVAVTTRNACVGNGVPWVRVGVGAVATQASTRVEYGHELLDLLDEGVAPAQALARAVAADAGAERRQVGVIGIDGRSAQHTGQETNDWSGHRSGPWYATQGNTLVGAEVLAAVSRAFEASQGSARHLSDRLIEALAAGQAAGGDRRKGRMQSAAVMVADPRPGMARRLDGVTTNINVCEHPAPVAELRRIYDVISQTLGYRTLRQAEGRDVRQLKVILHALGYFRAGAAEPLEGEDASLYTTEAVAAVERFRADQGLSTSETGSPPGLVDGEAVRLLWAELAERGLEEVVRRRLLDMTRIRR